MVKVIPMQDRTFAKRFQDCSDRKICGNFAIHHDGNLDFRKLSPDFLILSGLATGASWLCYYKALQMGDASKVVPIDKLSVVITLLLAFFFLHEQFTVKSLIGCVLIGTGTLLMVL